MADPVFQALHKTREAAYKLGLFQRYEAKVPVISVGNLATGGTGKTPLVIWLAGRLRALGLKPAVVSRGYGGSNRDAFLLVSDGTSEIPLHGPTVVGDEPYLIACRLPKVPVLIGRKRSHPIQAAQELFASDLIILDDGFQHLAVARDVNILILTGSEDQMLPLVELREPLSALVRANVFLLQAHGDKSSAQWMPRNTPSFRYCHRASSLVRKPFPFEAVDLGALAHRKVTLVSGIARPERFLRTTQGLQWDVVSHVTFRDHHLFTSRELQKLVRDSSSSELVFTEKDWVRLPAWFQSHERTWALRADLDIDREDIFLKIVMESIGQRIHA